MKGANTDYDYIPTSHPYLMVSLMALCNLSGITLLVLSIYYAVNGNELYWLRCCFLFFVILRPIGDWVRKRNILGD